MAELTVLHNPRCSMSRHAVDVVTHAGVDAEVVQYLRAPLTAAAGADPLVDWRPRTFRR